MRVPILKQADYLIASLQPGLADQEWLAFSDALAESIGRVRTRGVIIDVTLLDVMDSFAVRTLRTIAAMCRLRGARTVVVGVQPEVAFAMTQLGLTLANVETALDLEEGLALLESRRHGKSERRN